jgi:hypothetical protein
MALELVTSNIWRLITQTFKSHPSKSMVAVAYFSQNAAIMLPLKKGSTLLVNASEKAVKSGQTCPAELLKLYYKGVKVYSLENLHAKIYVVGNTLLIGSANVSGNSSKLQEAIIKTNDRQAVNDAKAFIERHCNIEMGEDQLTRLKKLYRKPKVTGVSKQKTKNTKSLSANQPSFFVFKLFLDYWTEEETQQAEIGKKEALKNQTNKSRHHIDIITLTSESKAIIGDTIMQIVSDGTNSYVSPPGTLVHVRKWSNGKKTIYFCYLEVPIKRRKNIKYLKRRFDPTIFKRINRHGKKNKDIAGYLINLWK